MLTRLLIVLCLVIIVGLIAFRVRARARSKTTAAQGRILPDELHARLPGASPGIVYFYGPHCATCKQQGVVLDALVSESQVPVVRIDAVRERALAQTLTVMTVPTSIIVDSDRTIRKINLGFCSQAMLMAQIASL